MARTTGEVILRQAAAQALPILRHAAAEAADPGIAEAARRRLGIIREVLHTLPTPRFGRRDIPVPTPAPEERHRQVLGLPLDRRLSAPEIHRAWKRAAKSAHPDAGGSVQAFQALSAAREALIEQVSSQGVGGRPVGWAKRACPPFFVASERKWARRHSARVPTFSADRTVL